METIDPIYQLGRVAVKDESTERSSFYVVNELNTSGAAIPAAQKVLRFRIDDLNSYLVLSRSYLQLRCAVTYAAAVNSGAGPSLLQRVAIKNGLHSIFRRAVLRINGQSVNEFSDYHYNKQELESILASLETKRTLGSAMGYFDPTEPIQTSSGLADPTVVTAAGVMGFDRKLNFSGMEFLSHDSTGAPGLPLAAATTAHYTSFLKRVARSTPIQDNSAAGAEVVACVPLHVLFPFLKAYDRVMRGMSIEMEFELCDQTQLIEGNAVQAAGSTFGWSQSGPSATLFVKRVVPSLRVRNELNAMITKGYSLNGFSYEDVQLYKFPITAAGQVDWRITTTVSRPTRIFVAKQLQARNTQSDHQSGCFDAEGMTAIQLFCNGQPVPDLRYEVNFPQTKAELVSGAGGQDRRDRMRAYLNFLEQIGQDQSSVTSDLLGNGVSYDSWVHNFPVFVFDVSRNLPQDTAFTGATELLVRFSTLAGIGASDMIAWVYHEKLADIKFTSTESSIVIS